MVRLIIVVITPILKCLIESKVVLSQKKKKKMKFIVIFHFQKYFTTEFHQ